MADKDNGHMMSEKDMDEEHKKRSVKKGKKGRKSFRQAYEEMMERRRRRKGK